MNADQLIHGRPVQVSEDKPRMQCSCDFVRLQSPELVAETNAWMADFFGYSNLMPDDVVWELMGNTLVMNRRTYTKACAAIKAEAIIVGITGENNA